MSSEGTSRNLGQEVDDLREMVNAMTESQSRMEDLLKQLIEALGLKKNDGGGIPQNENGNLDGDRDGFVILEKNAKVLQEKTQLNKNLEAKKLRDELLGKMQEQIKAIQGLNRYESLEIEELCPVTEVPIPKGFIIPDFSKYDGGSNPLFHLKTYCTKMSIWSRDEKLLINFFHESLTGPALEWYIQVDHSKISCWRDLTDLFLGQYRFNLDSTPTREQLGTLQKRHDETFKQYAQRWRALASQVQPPLTLSEMSSYFMGTLESPYIGPMVGATYRDFSDLILAGERIEILAGAGKLLTESKEDDAYEKEAQT